jgi:sugar lactone lactonase YvrE
MRKIKSVLSHYVALMAFIQTAEASLTFSVTPTAVSNTYAGAITLQIGGLTNGETVVIKKFLDLNTNGVIDANDSMVRDFQLTTGQSGAMVIGGVTNVNVPLNSSTTTNSITTTLNFQNGQIMDTLAGQYLFQVSCASGQITNSLAVTNSYPQQFTGTVLSGGNPVPNAVVLLLPASGKIDNAPTPGVVANNSGVYALQAPAGTYALSAFKTNFLTGAEGTHTLLATYLVLANGGTTTTNLNLTAATESISGKIIDAATSSGLPGVLVALESTNGLGLCYTDANGNFTAGVTAGQWSVNGENQAVALLGYVGFNDGVPVNATGGSVANVTIAENKATALFYGHFTNNLGTPLAGFAVEAEDLNNVYDSFGSADANGYYVTGALGNLGGGNTYEVNLASDFAPSNELYAPSPYNYGNGGTNLANNTAAMVNFTDILATNLITGRLKDSLGNPIAGVQIYDSDGTPINGSYYEGHGAITDPNGNFVLNVCNGTWYVYVEAFGDNYSLPTNYTSPAAQSPVILNNNAVVDFTATNLLFPFVTTTTLPNGTNGVAYNQPLAASYGQPPYAWTNSSGALPPGLTLTSNGVVSGTPTNNGTYDFSVQVTDALSRTATQPLTLSVFGPPVVVIAVTNNLVTATAGSPAAFVASVTGAGPFSFQWQLNGTNLPSGIISTVAGNGTNAYSGDGGPATNAELRITASAAVDVNGNLFIADEYNQRIREVGPGGIINTVAGVGGYGFFGDQGTAATAELDFPLGVAVDASGNIFIADTQNNRIRKVGTDGIINTVAGNGNQGYSGDGGPATNAELSQPYGVAVDALGNIFIADQNNARIRKVGANGIITTVAGNGTVGYSGDGGMATNAKLDLPDGLSVDATGNLFFADKYNQRIRKVGANGIITTVVGSGGFGYSGDGGAATNATLYYPTGVAVDAIGNLFIADWANNVIRMVGINGVITTVAGGGSHGLRDGGAATNAQLAGPDNVAVDANDNLFISDSDNFRVRKVVSPGVPGPTLVLNEAGYGNAGAYDVVVTSPYGSVTSSVVNLVITPLQVSTTALPNAVNGAAYNQMLVASGDQSPYGWLLISGSLPSNLILATNGVISGTPTINGTFNFTVKVTDALSGTATKALSLTVGSSPGVSIQLTNNPVTVIVGSNAIFAVTATGTGPFSYQWRLNGSNLLSGVITTVAGNGILGSAGDGGAATNAELGQPFGVVADAGGNLFIADQGNQRIRKVATNGIITTVAGNGAFGFSGDGGAATNAELNGPWGMQVDTSGNLFIADSDNNRIRKVGTNGIITTVAGSHFIGFSGDGGAATNAALHIPAGLAFDATGNLFIADEGNQRIREVATNGIITTVAGNGINGYSGDGGMATNAELNGPTGIAVDATGDLFIADVGNERIRMVETNGIITTVAGNGGFGYSGDGGAATNALLYFPQSVVVDATGNLFLADRQNGRIREVGTNGIISTAAGGGSNNPGDGGVGTNAELGGPFGVAFDATGNLFIADYGGSRIRRVAFDSSVLSPTLLLNDVGFGNAGAYDVVVSSTFGSVTSSIVNLTLTLPGFMLSAPRAAITGGNFTFLLSGPAGSNYVLQVSTNLLNWSSVTTSTIPTGGSITLTNAIRGIDRGFYRAHLQ